jgi:hypothetical protein
LYGRLDDDKWIKFLLHPNDGEPLRPLDPLKLALGSGSSVRWRTDPMAAADVHWQQAITSSKNMTNKNLASEITKHLTNCGVKLIELPGGSVQLLGKWGTITLTQDISALRPTHIHQLCGMV